MFSDSGLNSGIGFAWYPVVNSERIFISISGNLVFQGVLACLCVRIASPVSMSFCLASGFCLKDSLIRFSIISAPALFHSFETPKKFFCASPKNSSISCFTSGLLVGILVFPNLLASNGFFSTISLSIIGVILSAAAIEALEWFALRRFWRFIIFASWKPCSTE